MNPKSNLSGYVFLLILLFIVFSLTGCGSSDGGGAPGPADKSGEEKSGETPGTITGQAIKGPVAGGTVIVYAVVDGAKGPVLGTAITDSNGKYSIPTGNYSGPVFLEITGGSYVDEATGTLVNLPATAGSGLQSVVDHLSAGSTVQCQITPLTTMAVARVQNMSGGLTASNIYAANQEIGAYFGGIDILNTQPINPLVAGSASGANQSAINYGLILAGISQQAKTLGLLNPFELFTALTQDIRDGIFDGKSGTTDINVNGSALDPATGTSLLATAMNTFTQNATRNLSGATASDALLTLLQYSGGMAENPPDECGPVLEEVCDGEDNDCDGAVDEGVLNACGTCGDVPAEVCNGADDNCDGNVDEGVLNVCGTCGDVPAEVCDGMDNDCDGAVDEGVLNACGACGPVPAEICDGQDNNCDGQTDEGVLNACGACGDVPPEGCGGHGSAAPKTWTKTYGGQGSEWPAAIQQTSDGGYILFGSTDSFGINGDIWVIKLDENGEVVWQKTYGGDGWEWPSAVQQTSDGGYILVSSLGTSDDIWVIKLDENGEPLWQKTYGGEGWEWTSAIQQTSDSGYVVAGSISDPVTGNNDAWILKLDENGSIQWEKSFGGEGYEWPSQVQQTFNGGYIVAGSIYDPFNFASITWVTKLDENGEALWQRSYSGGGYEWPAAIQQTTDGGYILAGFSSDLGGNNDAWVIKLDQDGGVDWQQAYGGAGWRGASSIRQTSDGGYIVAGYVNDSSGGDNDAWVIKLDENGSIVWQNEYGGKGMDSAASIQQTADGGYIMAAYTDSFGAGREDLWVLKFDPDGETNGCMAGLNISSASPVVTRETSVVPSDMDTVSVNTTSTVLDTNIIGVDSSAEPVAWCTGESVEGPPAHTLTVIKTPNGLVTSNPAGISCGYEDDGYGGLLWQEDCTHVHPDGTIINLTATPSIRSSFSGWIGDEDCADGQVTMDADKSCTANFQSRYRLDYVSGDNQTWGGGGMPFPMIFKIFDKTTGTYVEYGFDGLNMSAVGDIGYSDGGWCWGCYSPEIDSDLIDITRQTRSYWYVEPCSPMPPYDLHISVNAIDSYTGEQIENSPYLMQHTISREDTYCEQLISTTPELITPINQFAIIQNDSTLGCSMDPTRGYGFQIFFDWTDSTSPNGIARYHLYVQHKDSQYPLVDTFVTASDFTYTSCNSFIIDANLYDWEWRVQAEDNLGNLSPWSITGRLQFGQCRLEDGSFCYAPP